MRICKTYVLYCCRSEPGRRRRAGVPAALPHAAAPVAGVQGAGRLVGRRLPAGRGGRQAALPRAAPAPAPPLLLPPDAAQGLHAGQRGGRGARAAGLPGRRRARHRHERRLHAAAAGPAPVRRREAHDGRAAQQAARRCGGRRLPAGGEPALRGVQRAV